MKRTQADDGMSLIVQTVSNWLKGFILLYGIHIILYGHLTPGGGFAGGVIAASAFVLITLAEGRREGRKTFPPKAAATGDSLGVRGPFGNPWPIAACAGKDVVLVAGGIGLAPLRPVVYDLLAQRFVQ